MPHVKFTDSILQPPSADKSTWFTDPSCKGLRRDPYTYVTH